MKRTLIITALVALAGISSSAYADHAYSEPATEGNIFYDKARVTQVQELKEIVRVPVRNKECWTEEIEHQGRRGNPDAGMIAGGIIGGVLGNQVGRGRGKKVATVAGAIIGGAVGRDVASRGSEPYTSREHHCHVTNKYYEEERVSGYQVTYRYRGRTFTREMAQHPGRFVKVRVALAPLDD